MASETAAVIRASLVDCLRGILSASAEVRSAAEEQLKMLETTDEFGIYLTEFTVSPDSDLAGRQLASVLLKQYVEAHWCTVTDKFRAPVCPAQTKAVIREVLPRGLADSSRKVRNSVAYALSKIASFDFPEDWPNLFDWLVEALNSSNPDLVHGCMRVLSETCSELSEDQLGIVTPNLVPSLYRIYVGEEAYGLKSRARACEIFTNLVQSIEYFSIKTDYRKLLTPILPQFVKDLARGLAVPLGEQSDVGLQKQIFRALGAIVQVFPKLVRHLFKDIIKPLWKVLTSSAEVYVRDVVNSEGGATEDVNSDGESVTTDGLVYAVFEFTGCLVQQQSFHPMLLPHLSDIIFFSLYYMQMTTDDIETWSLDVNAFVEDEDEETLSYSVRLSAKDLLMQIFDPGFDTELTKKAPFCLWQSIEKLFQQLTNPATAEDPNRWKLFEVVTAVLTVHSPDVMPHEELAPGVINLLGFLQTSFQQGVHPPFLVGRIMEFQASICQYINDEVLSVAIERCVHAINQENSPILRVHACKALALLCCTLRRMKRAYLFEPTSAAMAVALIGMISSGGISLLQLGLETLVLILSLSRDTTVLSKVQLGEMAIQLLLAYSQDHVLLDTVKDLIVLMAEISSCMDVLHQRILPVLMNLLSTSVNHASGMLIAVSLDVIAGIIRHTPAPLPEHLLQHCLRIAEFTMQSDDETIMQNGGECLRAFVSAAGDQLATWPDAGTTKLLDVIVTTTCELLHPGRPENSAMFVGRLVCMLAIKLRTHLTTQLNGILRAVLGKLLQVQKDINVQSLITVFGRLMEFYMTDVISFLDSVCGPDGKSSLHFVLSRWCESQSHFYGQYEKTVCLLGLCHLLRHGLNTGDERLQAIVVQGDEVFGPNEGIRTRSKTRQAGRQVTIIPVLCKIFKILLQEMAFQFELSARTIGRPIAPSASADQEDVGEDGGDGDAEDDDWEDVDDEDGGALGSTSLSSFMDGLYGSMDDLDMPRDPDLAQDRVMQIDLPLFLADFVLEVSRQPCLPELCQYLQPAERKTLDTVMQSGAPLQALKQQRLSAAQQLAAAGAVATAASGQAAQ